MECEGKCWTLRKKKVQEDVQKQSLSKRALSPQTGRSKVEIWILQEQCVIILVYQPQYGCSFYYCFCYFQMDFSFGETSNEDNSNFFSPGSNSLSSNWALDVTASALGAWMMSTTEPQQHSTQPSFPRRFKCSFKIQDASRALHYPKSNKQTAKQHSVT